MANAAPVAIPNPPPTMPFAPSMPMEKSATCIEPPLPRQAPVALPYNSANMAPSEMPFAMACP